MSNFCYRVRYRKIRRLELILTYLWVGAVVVALGVALTGCATELRSVRGQVVTTPIQHIDLCAREPQAAVCPK